VRNITERSIVATLVLSGAFSIFTTAAIIVTLAVESYQFFRLPEASLWGFLTDLRWSPLLGTEKHFGIWPLIGGTLIITLIAMIVALPLGLASAIYLSEYAKPKVRATLKPVLEVIAGVPTVVFGFFALTVITPGLQRLHGVFDGTDGFNAFNVTSAGIAVGIMCLPIVTSLSEDALRAVPQSLRAASYGLGATRFEVSTKVVVPAALSGIIAAFLLAIARAVGETMIVALAAGSTPMPLADNPLAAIDPRNPAQTMTGYMVMIFTGDVSNFGVEYYSSYAVASTLFLLTLVFTLIGNRIRVKYRQAYE
jgi:phosphate transport system permease protein